MKKYFVLGVLLFLGAAFAAAPSVDVDYELTPSSVSPGGSSQVVVTITNGELLTDLENLEVELRSRSSGISVIGGKNDLGTLPATSTSSAAFTVRALSTAKPGPYTLEVTGTYDYNNGTADADSSFRITIPITVSYVSNLEIYARDTQITPGASSNLLITIKNSGKSSIKDMTLTLSPSSTSVYPIGNVRTNIPSIAPGASSEANFEIRASDAAIAGIQQVTITASYTDTAGTSQSDTQSIGIIIVDAGTELVLDSIDSDLEPGKKGSVKVGVKNVGDVDLTNLYFSLDTPSDLSIIGSNEKLMDMLSAGESGTVEFKFDVSQDAEARPAESNLSITYQRASGKKEFSDSKSLGIDILGAVELRIVDVDVDKDDAHLEVDIANYGNKDADAIKVEALSNGEVFGTGFTDKIKPNKHKVFRFDLPSDTAVTIRATYKDYETDGGFETTEETINLDKSDLAANGGDSSVMIIGAVIVGVVVFWWWKKRKDSNVKIDVSKYK
jgi:hypothetical protein